jgi:hypothetical protein
MLTPDGVPIKPARGDAPPEDDHPLIETLPSFLSAVCATLKVCACKLGPQFTTI